MHYLYHLFQTGGDWCCWLIIVSAIQAVTEDTTVLLPNNTVMRDGFTLLAQQSNNSHPETFLDRLLAVADVNSGQPVGRFNNTITPSNQEAAGAVLEGFVHSHMLQGAFDFYSNSTVRPALPLLQS